MILKQTPLNENHIKLGARMIDFSGWSMPVQYSSIIREHENTRNNVSLFDTSHMGEFFVTGKESIDYLQKMLTADVEKVKQGKAKYCFLLNENGGIIDDLIFFHISDNYYMLCVNSGNIEKNLSWMLQNKQEYNVDIKDVSGETAKIDVQGPLSEKLIKQICTDELPARFNFINTKIRGISVILSRTGYTGEDGFELFFESNAANEIWELLMNQGKDFNIMPAGLGARDSLRLEACYPLYGNELNENITPLEAGLSFAVDFNKQKDFTGKQSLLKIKSDKLEQKLVALKLVKKAIPRQGYKLFKDDKKIGYITSGTFSPTFKKGISLAYVDKEYSKDSTEVEVEIRNTMHKAIITKKPLYGYKGENIK